jgi:hypothetical protein
LQLTLKKGRTGVQLPVEDELRRGIYVKQENGRYVCPASSHHGEGYQVSQG